MVVNLYPFYDKVSSAGGIEFEDGIDNIDIGGPAMIRAAAKVIHVDQMLQLVIHDSTVVSVHLTCITVSHFLSSRTVSLN